MITSENPAAAVVQTERPARGGALRAVLVVAVVVLVAGILVFAALSGLAAGPMTGT